MPRTQNQSSFNFLQDGDTPSPFPQRGESMSLATLGTEAKHRSARMAARQSALHETLRTDDITGAQPTRQKFVDKPPLEEIPGARPKKQTQQNRISQSLHTADIDGAKSRPFTFQTSRVSDPLNPVYDMPVVDVKPPTPPPQVHKTLDISEIEGAHAKKHVEKPPRDIMNANDIEGAQADWKPQYKRSLQTRDIMAVSDINLKDHRRSTRQTNPLDPQYEFKDSNTGNVVTYGEVQGARPNTTKPRRDGAALSLTTNDIEGARADSKKHTTSTQGKGQIKNTNFVGDIAGARPKQRVPPQPATRASTPRCFKVAKEALTGGASGQAAAGGRPASDSGSQNWWPNDKVDQAATGYLAATGEAESHAPAADAAPVSRPPRVPKGERMLSSANAEDSPAVIMPVQRSFRDSKPPSSHGKPPSSHGKPPSSHGKPPSSHGKPPSSQGKPPSSHGKPPSSHGKPPSSHGKPASSHGGSSRPPSSRRDALSSRGSVASQSHGSAVRTPSGMSIPVTRTRVEADRPEVTASGAEVLTIS